MRKVFRLSILLYITYNSGYQKIVFFFLHNLKTYIFYLLSEFIKNKVYISVFYNSLIKEKLLREMHFGQGWPKMPLYKIFCNLNAGDHTKIMFRIRSTMFRIRSKSLISTLLGFAIKRCCAKTRCLNGKLQR